jgi:hypothetical protein
MVKRIFTAFLIFFGAFVNNQITNINDNNIIPNCLETDPASICIQKSPCCHVTNQYSSYSYSACVDVKSQSNFQQFCQNFYQLNRNNGYFASECICYGNYMYSSSSYIHFKWGSIMFIILLTITYGFIF